MIAINGFVTTSEISFHLLHLARKVKLSATGKVLKMGKRQVVTEMNCNDEHGSLIAHATGTFLIMNKKKLNLKKE